MSLASYHRDIIVAAFDYLQVPLATEKLEGPTTHLIFLGICLDTVRMEARLPDDKISELRAFLSEFSSIRCTTVAKFASFLGKLSFASAVVTASRTFISRLWDVSKRFHAAPPYYKIVLSAECKLDIHWWFILLRDWNGI